MKDELLWVFLLKSDLTFARERFAFDWCEVACGQSRQARHSTVPLTKKKFKATAIYFWEDATHSTPLRVGDHLSSIQSILAFDRWVNYPQFNNDRGFGRIALLACILGIVLGMHALVGIQLVLLQVGLLPKHLIFGSKNEGCSSSSNEEDLQIMILLQWVLYIIVLCIFHLAEFFTTAAFNPTATSADSFMVCITTSEYDY